MTNRSGCCYARERAGARLGDGTRVREYEGRNVRASPGVYRGGGLWGGRRERRGETKTLALMSSLTSNCGTKVAHDDRCGQLPLHGIFYTAPPPGISPQHSSATPERAGGAHSPGWHKPRGHTHLPPQSLQNPTPWSRKGFKKLIVSGQWLSPPGLAVRQPQ